MSSPWIRGVCCAALLFGLFAGCSRNAGPEQYHVSGTITFRGQPLAGGMIYFEPAEGSTGHTGFARIVAGHYDTAAPGGKGHIGGKLAARIEPGINTSEPIVDDNAPQPPRPFHAWQTIVELPKAKSTHDFTVPDDADKIVAPKPVIGGV